MKLPWDSQDYINKRDGRYHRERSADLYHTSRWTRLSRAYRAMHPLCAQCLKEGRYVSAEVVDHIVPYPVCKDFFDEHNLQSLCSYHNIEKGNKDKITINQWKLTHQHHGNEH